MSTHPPSLPSSAPFTPAQRGWLNGYLAALSQATGDTTASATPDLPEPSETAPSGLPVTILWGSQTGNTEGLAKKLSKRLTSEGHIPAIYDMAEYPRNDLPREKRLLILTSTYGDGEAPDNAADFHEFLLGDEAPELAGLEFAVFALGDSSYPDFCQCGIEFDERLAALGATRLCERIDADVEYDDPFSDWGSTVLERLAAAVPA